MSFVEMARKKWGDRANAEREKASAGAGVITALEQHLVREEDKTDLKNWQDKFQPQFQDSIVAELIELGLNPEYADRIEVRVSPVAKKPRPEDKPVLRYALGVFVASDNMDNASKNAITAFSKKLREI